MARCAPPSGGGGPGPAALLQPLAAQAWLKKLGVGALEGAAHGEGHRLLTWSLIAQVMMQGHLRLDQLAEGAGLEQVACLELVANVSAAAATLLSPFDFWLRFIEPLTEDCPVGPNLSRGSLSSP